jgi:hypothetical protein
MARTPEGGLMDRLFPIAINTQQHHGVRSLFLRVTDKKNNTDTTIKRDSVNIVDIGDNKHPFLVIDARKALVLKNKLSIQLHLGCHEYDTPSINDSCTNTGVFRDLLNTRPETRDTTFNDWITTECAKEDIAKAYSRTLVKELPKALRKPTKAGEEWFIAHTDSGNTIDKQMPTTPIPSASCSSQWDIMNAKDISRYLHYAPTPRSWALTGLLEHLVADWDKTIHSLIPEYNTTPEYEPMTHTLYDVLLFTEPGASHNDLAKIPNGMLYKAEQVTFSNDGNEITMATFDNSNQCMEGLRTLLLPTISGNFTITVKDLDKTLFAHGLETIANPLATLIENSDFLKKELGLPGDFSYPKTKINITSVDLD